jgi:hypothetical protein
MALRDVPGMLLKQDLKPQTFGEQSQRSGVSA